MDRMDRLLENWQWKRSVSYSLLPWSESWCVIYMRPLLGFDAAQVGLVSIGDEVEWYIKINFFSTTTTKSLFLSWPSVGSRPPIALASEWHFWRIMSVYEPEWKGHFVDKWITGLEDLLSTERRKTSLILTRTNIFGSVIIFILRCVFLHDSSCPWCSWRDVKEGIWMNK